MRLPGALASPVLPPAAETNKRECMQTCQNMLVQGVVFFGVMYTYIERTHWK